MDIDGTNKTTVEIFQNGGADETLAQAKAKFEKDNPGMHAVKAEFEYAHPGRPGEGRWVGIGITYAVTKARINAGDRQPD